MICECEEDINLCFVVDIERNISCKGDGRSAALEAFSWTAGWLGGVPRWELSASYGIEVTYRCLSMATFVIALPVRRIYIWIRGSDGLISWTERKI